MMILQKVRGNAVGQPDGQDDQDRHDPALQVSLQEIQFDISLKNTYLLFQGW